MIKNKIKLCGIGHDGRFTFIIVEKNKYFFNWLAEILYRSFKIDDADTYTYKNKKGKWVTKKKQINQYIDEHEVYYRINEKERVDVFYGKKNIFITLNASIGAKKIFLGILEEYSVWKRINKKAVFRQPF